MERDSLLYKTRRKCQVIAHKVISDEFLSKLYFKIVMKKKLNLNNPKTFNEKLQWLKLYYMPNNALIIQCADKYEVRKHIKYKGYSKKLVPILGVWNDATNINWDSLPEKFVLKCNHGCAYNIVISDKNKVKKIEIINQLNSWLKEDFGAFNVEPHYSAIKNHFIICEKFLGECIVDYKFFCFNGEPKYVYVSNNMIHDREAQIGFFNLDGSKMPLERDDYMDIGNVTFPIFFEEMQAMAKDLAKDFPFVRVDFFLADNTFYFAELTFTPCACMMPFNPENYDIEWGKILNINDIINS